METAQVSFDDENDDTEEIEEEQGQEDEGRVETAVPVSSDEASGGTEEMEEEDQQAAVSDAETVTVSSDEGADDAAPPCRASRDLASPLATIDWDDSAPSRSCWAQSCYGEA